MKHKFEEYFQLPWSIKRRTVCWEMGVEENFVYLDLNGESGEHASEGVPSLVDFTARRHNVDFDKYDVNNAREDALKYLVQCANLMPEAAALIKRWRDEKAKRREELCTSCANDEDGYMDSDECDTCLCKELDADIELADKLLAKLEGGAEDESN